MQYLHDHGDPSVDGAIAIRIKRGTDGDENNGTSNVGLAGVSLFSPLLISTYGTGDRPHIRYPGDSVLHFPYSGITRPGADEHTVQGDFVYINGLNLESTYTRDRIDSYGIDLNNDSDHYVVSDCIIKGFSTNLNINPQVTSSHSRWWTVFRNIIIDSGSSDNPQGIFVGGNAGARGPVVISQNVLDHNGYGAPEAWGGHPDERLTYRHNIYFGATQHGPFIWGNSITRGAAFGVKMDCGGVIYGNVFAENALGCGVGGDRPETGSDGEGGGRIAHNYFEHAEDMRHYESGTVTIDNRGWGPGLGGNPNDVAGFGPSIIELNCMADSWGHSPSSARVEESITPVFNDPGPQAIIRNNTGRAYGSFEVNTSSSNTSPEAIIATRNVWDSRGSLYSPDNALTVRAWPIQTGQSLSFNRNLYKSGTSNSIIYDEDDFPNSPISLATWQASPYSQDPNSVSYTPIYYDVSTLGYHYDLGSLAYDLGYPILADPPVPNDFYKAIRARPIATITNYDFLFDAAKLISAHEVSTSPPLIWPDPDPMPFIGSGDGTDPQLP